MILRSWQQKIIDEYPSIIKQKRIGLHGKEFYMYKLRTMHPFSEYLQEYVYKKNELQEGGKIKNDFRISPEGRIFRKFWIDEIPMLAVIATQAIGKTIIKGARELRVKESDRIKAIVINLRKMGASVEEFEDGLTITGPTKLKGANINTFKDHRIAMAFTIAGLVAEGNTILDDYDCVNISFPDFFNKIKMLVK